MYQLPPVGFGLEQIPAHPSCGVIYPAKLWGRPMFLTDAGEKVASFSLVRVHAWLSKLLAASDSDRTALFPRVHLITAHQRCAE